VSGADALAAFDLAEAADLSWRSGRSVAVRYAGRGYELAGATV
jgi:hypothetical protein